LVNLISAEQIPILRNAQIELFNSKEKQVLVNAIYNGRNSMELVDLNNMQETAKKISENEETKFRVEEL
jgi:hypothetical protein